MLTAILSLLTTVALATSYAEDDGIHPPEPPEPPPLIDTDSAEVATTWTRVELSRIPAGRDISSVVRLSPGVASISNGWFTGGGSELVWIVDGIRVGPLPSGSRAPSLLPR